MIVKTVLLEKNNTTKQSTSDGPLGRATMTYFQGKTCSVWNPDDNHRKEPAREYIITDILLCKNCRIRLWILDFYDIQTWAGWVQCLFEVRHSREE